MRNIRRWGRLLMLCLAIGSLSAAAQKTYAWLTDTSTGSPLQVEAASYTTGNVIVLDAGHGGYDTAAESADPHAVGLPFYPSHSRYSRYAVRHFPHCADFPFHNQVSQSYYSFPFVLGSVSPLTRIAVFKARPSALKIASTL